MSGEAMWWILGLWVGGSLLLTVGIALGGALGYRRGWEDHRACVADDGGPAVEQAMAIPELVD